MSFGKRKDGRYYRKRRRVYETFPEPTDPPKRNKPSFFHGRDDDRRRKELEEFARLKSQEFEKREALNRKKRKLERFNRVINLHLGHAKALLISATPVIISADPSATLGTIYTAWKFGKYGYKFVNEVIKEYKATADLDEAILTVTKRELQEYVISKLKSITVKNASQIAAKTIWEHCKKNNPTAKTNPAWDAHAESAMAKTIEEIASKVA